MVYMNHGTFQIEETGEGRLVRYDFSSFRSLVIGLVAALLFLFWITSRGAPIFAIVFAIFMVTLQVGVTKLMARMRIPRRVRAFVTHG